MYYPNIYIRKDLLPQGGNTSSSSSSPKKLIFNLFNLRQFPLPLTTKLYEIPFNLVVNIPYTLITHDLSDLPWTTFIYLFRYDIYR